MFKKPPGFLIMSLHHTSLHKKHQSNQQPIKHSQRLQKRNTVKCQLEKNTNRLEENLVVRSFIIPNQQQHSHPFLRLILQQIAKRQIATSWQRPSRLSNKPHLMVNRPAHQIHHVMSLRYSITNILPTLPVPVNLSILKLNLR